MKRFLIIWLPLFFLLLILTGCSDTATAGKRLEKQLKSIADNYMKNEFLKQIKLNSHCRSWLVAPDRLLLFGFDGSEVRKLDPGHAELHAMALARCYVGQELYMQCRSASWSNLVKVNHERYKYRCLITFKITEVRRMWQHMPAISIVNVALKTALTEDQLKEELENYAVKLLPGEKYDLHYLYTRPGSDKNLDYLKNREYTVTIFACYDPELPGWVPEDPELAKDIKLEIKKPDWLEMSIDKYKLPKNLTRYKDFLYWKESAVFQQKYDEGFLYRYGRWLTADDAQKAEKLMALVNAFDSANADLSALSTFLREISEYTPLLGISEAEKKSIACAENLINNYLNTNDYKNLSYLAHLLEYNSDFKLIESAIKAPLERALAVVKRRVNLNIAEKIQSLKEAGKQLDEFVLNKKMTPEQINIILVRQENNLKKICSNNATEIAGHFFRLRFNTLLQGGYISEVNKFYNQAGLTRQLKELELEVLQRCDNCRKGRQKCIYCVSAPGKCTQCEGKNEFSGPCATCSNSGKCEHCSGSLKIKCLKCSGRGFVILKDQIGKLITKDHQALEKIISDSCADLENSRIN